MVKNGQYLNLMCAPNADIEMTDSPVPLERIERDIVALQSEVQLLRAHTDQLRRATGEMNRILTEFRSIVDKLSFNYLY
jgi:hypothetical protein